MTVTRNQQTGWWLLAKELDYPCKLASIKAQDKGHWFLSDAIHRCTMLWSESHVP